MWGNGGVSANSKKRDLEAEAGDGEPERLLALVHVHVAWLPKHHLGEALPLLVARVRRERLTRLLLVEVLLVVVLVVDNVEESRITLVLSCNKGDEPSGWGILWEERGGGGYSMGRKERGGVFYGKDREGGGDSMGGKRGGGSSMGGKRGGETDTMGGPCGMCQQGEKRERLERMGSV